MTLFENSLLISVLPCEWLEEKITLTLEVGALPSTAGGLFQKPVHWHLG